MKSKFLKKLAALAIIGSVCWFGVQACNQQFQTAIESDKAQVAAEQAQAKANGQKWLEQVRTGKTADPALLNGLPKEERERVIEESEKPAR